jgi:bacteriocin biosynthesis cyclodehydratase domain-containing protein
VQLRAVPLVRRDTTTVQVGTDPRWAVLLAELSPGAARALGALPAGASERTLHAALDAERVPVAERDAVLAHLQAAHLLVPAPRAVPAPGAGDQRAWSLLAADGDVSASLTRRARAVVRVVGLGRTAAVLVATLAAAGVGTLELDDPGPVEPADAGFGGLTPGDVGARRDRALAAAVHAARPDVRVGAARRGLARVPDVVVLVDRLVADPVGHVPLLDQDVVHLSVLLREASVLVGPLVVPGASACLTCLDRHRADADPGWPAVAAQLVARRTGPAEESALATVAGGLAAAQVLAHLDGRTSATRDGALEVALPDLAVRTQTWAPHPSCGCGAHVAAGGETPA